MKVILTLLGLFIFSVHCSGPYCDTCLKMTQSILPEKPIEEANDLTHDLKRACYLLPRSYEPRCLYWLEENKKDLNNWMKQGDLPQRFCQSMRICESPTCETCIKLAGFIRKYLPEKQQTDLKRVRTIGEFACQKMFDESQKQSNCRNSLYKNLENIRESLGLHHFERDFCKKIGICT
ncbi:hypothetical protein P9112_003301 [Eukaryota sp. TZLM1-RC]